MTKKAISYLVAGLACALGAVLLANKYLLSQPSSQGPSIETVKVAVANTSIEFGEPLVLEKTDEQDPNIGWATWPKKHVPEGAFTSKDKLSAPPRVALSRFVRFEPILESRVQRRDRLIPDQAFVEHFSFNPDDLTGVSAGDRIDVLKITESHGVEDFIRCARVISVGKPPDVLKRHGSGGNGKSNRIYVLLPKDIRETIIETKLRHRLMIKPSLSRCENELAELVEKDIEVRARKARQALGIAEALMEMGEYGAAQKKFQQLAEQYPRLPEAQQARKHIQEIREDVAQTELARVRKAYDSGQYAEAVELGRKLAEAYPDLAEQKQTALDIAEKAERQMQELEREHEYRRLCSRIRDGLKGGDIPGVTKLLQQLEREFSGYNPGTGLKAPGEVEKEVENLLKKMRSEFENDLRVLKYHIQNGNEDKAVKKLGEMQETFSEHPALKREHERMKQRGWVK